MIRWVHLFKDYYLGIFALGIAAFALQEIPYMVMPMLNLSPNPIMEMDESSMVLNAFEKVFGILTVLFLVLIVRKDDQFFSLKSKSEKVFFSLAVLAIAINFSGWLFYFNGIRTSISMIVCLFSMVPLYYVFIGLWRKNYLLVISGVCFFFYSHASWVLEFAVLDDGP